MRNTMLVVAIIVLSGFILGYQTTKPCDKACFDEKTKQAVVDLSREDARKVKSAREIL